MSVALRLKFQSDTHYYLTGGKKKDEHKKLRFDSLIQKVNPLLYLFVVVEKRET